MSQLAQFSSLEQMTNMSDTMTSLANTSAVTQGVDLIGRNLTFTRSDGSSGTGVAQSITVAGGSVVIDVGGENVDPADITGVGAAPSTTPSTGS
jgi:flagellar basal-body rod modification protein FlgD